MSEGLISTFILNYQPQRRRGTGWPFQQLDWILMWYIQCIMFIIFCLH